jgi:hypothetical protein
VFIGGNGGKAAASTGIGGNGGAGGSAGNGGNGGTLTFNIKNSNFTSAGDILTSGGAAGTLAAGSTGGTGGDGGAQGGSGGTGGKGANGGTAGSFTFNAGTANVDTSGFQLRTNGGAGSSGSTGGIGGNALTASGKAGNGGVGGSGGKGGNAGVLTINTSGTVTVATTTSAQGGAGGTGAQGGAGGTGGAASASAGNGGDGGTGGAGGNGANLKFPGNGLPNTNVAGGAGQAGGTGGAAGSGKSGKDNSTTTAPSGSNGKILVYDDGDSDDNDNSDAANEHKAGKRRKLAETDQSDSVNPLQPVAFVQSGLMLAGKHLSLTNVLLAPKNHDASALAGNVKVRVSKGSAAFIVNSGHEVCVMSLHDGRTGDVSILTGSQRINLRAGEEVIISDDSTSDFHQANPVPAVAVRKQSEQQLADGSKLFTSEFSLLSAMSKLDTLQSLKHSAKANDRILYGKMMKNATVLQLVTAPRGPYKVW